MVDGLKVELLEVKSISTKIGGQWSNNFNVKIKVDGIELDFNSDLKDGIMAECQKIFDNTYNYKSFDYRYSRTPSEFKMLDCED